MYRWQREDRRERIALWVASMLFAFTAGANVALWMSGLSRGDPGLAPAQAPTIPRKVPEPARLERAYELRVTGSLVERVQPAEEDR